LKLKRDQKLYTPVIFSVVDFQPECHGSADQLAVRKAIISGSRSQFATEYIGALDLPKKCEGTDMTFIANARMYAVSPEAEAAWQGLVAHVAEDAGISLTYQPYSAPQPLEDLWRRTDVGCVQMCGYPIALGVADVIPLASAIPAAPWAEGKPVYRTDLIVRKDAPYNGLADTFGGTVGWTVEHSHSGFNALRHHLLDYRTDERPQLYRQSIGNLITARGIVDGVLDGTIDVGPLDAYWHMLIRKYNPKLTEGIRILQSTKTAPMPAFVAAPAMVADDIVRLRDAFSEAHTRPWFDQFREALLISGFAHVTRETFDQTMAWDRAAKAAGYPKPA
jgi:ABC-type phosphate/phosphonate transport system substrate-binding protein